MEYRGLHSQQHLYLHTHNSFVCTLNHGGYNHRIFEGDRRKRERKVVSRLTDREIVVLKQRRGERGGE